MNSNKTLFQAVLHMIILCTVLSVFFLFYWRNDPIEYDNLAGSHSWLAASTIKFVNNWLKEDPLSLHYLNYENPLSIETDVASRGAYASYPTGCTLLVWAAAKATGLSHIDTSFIKHFAQHCMWVEMLLLAGFLYLLLTRTTSLNGLPKCLLTAAFSGIWILLPANHYYLINSFFADQAVILFVMLFLFLDYVRSWEVLRENRLLLTLVLICEFFTIFLGVLTDYYFWILVFFAFLFDLIANCLNKKPMKAILLWALFYCIPVLSVIGIFLWQWSIISDSLQGLIRIFLFRSGTAGEDPVWAMLRYNFAHAFANASENQLIYLCIYTLGVVILGVLYLKKKKNVSVCFTDRNVSAVLINTIAIFFQIFLLKNHSAIHQVSMIKVGWFEVMLMILPAILVSKLTGEHESIGFGGLEKEISVFTVTLLLSCFCVLSILNFPESTYQYADSRYEFIDYSKERIIRDNTDYYDVCFSYTYEIPDNPPNSLAVSGKRVDKIGSADELETMFPQLSPEARKILVIEKAVTGLSQKTLDEQETLAATGTILYDGENLCLIRLDPADSAEAKS